MPGSGYRTPPQLVRRGDGQMIQLTPLLYLVLDAVDGRRTQEEIAARVSAAFGRQVTPANVDTLVDGRLRPLGVLLRGDGSEPELRKSNPLLGLRHRVAVTDPVKTDRLTSPFARLFNPVLVTCVVAFFCYLSWWLLLDKGLASATHEAFHKPGLLLLVFVVTVLSAGFHEFGHAAAARRGGSTPGVMGMGLYLFWPAFYTDVTDSYRLGRVGRLRTDLGGLYFNAIVAVGIVGIWWASGYDALLLVVATQILQMLRQLTPLIRFDGYHVLADLTGVPDLYHHIKPILLGLLPWRWRDPKVTVLKPWARAVVSVWVVVVVPLLAFSMLMMVLTLPRVLATAWVSLGEQWAVLRDGWADGSPITVLARFVAILALVLPVLGVGYILVRLVRQVAGAVLKRTEGRPFRRALAGVTALALVAGLIWAWWPKEDTYRPIAAYERGTLADVLPRAAPTYAPGLTAGQQGSLQTVWPGGSSGLPTRDAPQLAVIMVPRDTAAAGTTDGTATTGDSADPAAQPTAWVFPFDRPLPPGEGDNQALAVNTTDDTVVYDLAFALVWADEDQVLNTNEAFAAASCTGCAAVAVAFQVVMIIGDADVVVPQNLAVAANYNCVECLTYALASQLVVTLSEPLGEDSMAALRDLWAEIAAYAQNITEIPLSELQSALEGYQQEILAIIEQDPAAVPTATLGTGDDSTTDPGVTASPTTSASPSPSGSPGATSSPATDPTVASSSDPSPAPSSDPSSTSTPTPAASPTASATPTGDAATTSP
jgi:putative peptide zinc metalloprotease protein